MISDAVFWWVVFAVGLALVFDVINGFHDAANSIATVVSTRVLSPRVAVLWAAFFNFVAMFIFAPKVANTISKIVKINADDPVFVYVVLTGLLGAIVWDLLTWWWGLPTSSSHALVGGFAGAGIAHAGFGVLQWEKVMLTLQFIPLAPLLGAVLGSAFMIGVYWAFRRWRPAAVDTLFRRGQLLSAAAYSLGHGGNDAQKTMGIIVAVLVAAGYRSQESTEIPLWIVLSCHTAMGIGTAFGGWRIVKTMGMNITKLQPMGGFCAESAGALTLFASTMMGVPVSTTHTITGAIIGVGSTKNASSVRWGLAGRIVWAWVLTIPLSALVSALCFYALGWVVGY